MSLFSYCITPKCNSSKRNKQTSRIPAPPSKEETITNIQDTIRQYENDILELQKNIKAIDIEIKDKTTTANRERIITKRKKHFRSMIDNKKMHIDLLQGTINRLTGKVSKVGNSSLRTLQRKVTMKKKPKKKSKKKKPKNPKKPKILKLKKTKKPIFLKSKK